MAGTVDASTAGRGLSGSWYLGALLAAPVMYEVMFTVFGDASLFGFAPWSLVVLYGTALVAGVCWVRYSSTSAWSGHVRAWLMLGIVLWLYVLLAATVQGEEVVAAAAVVPLTFILILLRPPSRVECWRAADAFSSILVIASALVLVLEVGHVIPDWYAAHGANGAARLPFDQSNYWLPLASLLGLEGRWGGVPGLPGAAGHAGAFLVVFGLVRPKARRWIFASAGIAILLLTDSRTSYAAAAVGLCVLAASPNWASSYWKPTPTRLLALLLGLAFVVRVMAKVVVDPSLTGRVSVWPQFAALIKGFLPFGIGSEGIDQAIDSGDIPEWAYEGHNDFLDTLVRYGVVGLVLAVLFVGLAVVLTVGQLRTEVGVGIALAAVLVVASLGDRAIDFVYPSEGMSILLIAVLVSQLRRSPPSTRERTGASQTSLV